MKTVLILAGNQADIVSQANALCGFMEANAIESFDVWAFGEMINCDIRFARSPEKLIITRMNDSSGEAILEELESLAALDPPELLLFADDSFCASLASRAAYRLSGNASLGVNHLFKDCGSYFVEKFIYSQNRIGRFALHKTPYCLSISKGFHLSDPAQCYAKSIVNRKSVSRISPWILESREMPLSDESSLESAKSVVAIGKGIGNKENAESIETLARALNARLGASRPVVLNAWLPMNTLIGVSGSMIAPEFCLAIAVSGSAAFAVGIEKSQTIAAINTDPKAPIFQVADIGLVGDCKEIVKALMEIIQKDTTKVCETD